MTPEALQALYDEHKDKLNKEEKRNLLKAIKNLKQNIATVIDEN